jgi:hypothetical protein
MMGEHLRKTFFPAAGKDEKKVIAAFCKMSGDNALKTKPKVSHKEVFHGCIIMYIDGYRGMMQITKISIFLSCEAS